MVKSGTKSCSWQSAFFHTLWYKANSTTAHGGMRVRNREYRVFLPFLVFVNGFIVLVQEGKVALEQVYQSAGNPFDFILLGHSFPRVVLLETDATPAEPLVIRDDSQIMITPSIIDRKEEAIQSDCVSKPWQTTSHPNCNDIHSLGMIDLLSKATRRHAKPPRGMFNIFRNGGNRLAGKLALADEIVIYKTARYHVKFNVGAFQNNRIDSVAMEMLHGFSTDVYGYCGMASVSQLGGKSLDVLQFYKEELEPIKKLRYAFDIAKAVAHMHSIDSNYVSLVHRDLDESNFVLVDDTPKIIDFHASLFLKWNETGSKPCIPYITGSTKRPDTLPPEMLRDDYNDEAIDVYGIGAMYFFILTNGARMYHCERPRGVCGYNHRNNSISENEIRALKFNGTIPSLPKEIEQSTNQAIVAIRDVMKLAVQMDQRKRPSARHIASQLERVYQSLSPAGKNVMSD